MTSDVGRNELEEHYSAYLRAAVAKLGTAATLGSAVQRETRRRIEDRVALYRRTAGGDATTTTLLEAMARDHRVQTNKVSAWIARSSIPTLDRVPVEDRGLIVDALIKVVEQQVGTLEGLPPFSMIVADLQVLRARTRSKPRPLLKPSVPVLIDPEMPGGAVDGLSLGLGSWVTPNAVPEHVLRAVDLQLRGRLDAAMSAPPGWGRLVVVAGPPKAGKTRSVVEAIRSVAGDRRVWWPVLRRGVLASLMSPAPNDDVIVVLDDLQVLDPALPDELSDGLLFDLLQRAGAVVCTVHDAALSAWALNAIAERRRPYDRQLFEQLTKSPVRVPPALTKEESSQPSPTLAMLEDGGFDIERIRLAEALAAVEHLHALCEVARADQDRLTRWPLALAGVDAHHLRPTGATIEEIIFLFLMRWASLYPGTDYPVDEFSDAVAWATTPIGGAGSPHSVLMKPMSGAADDEYCLLDALADRIEPEWDSSHLRPMPGMPDLLLMACAFHLDDDQPWFEWMSTPFRHNLGVLAGQEAELSGDIDSAKRYYSAACGLTAGHANLLLGRVLLSEGKVAEATVLLERLVAADEVAVEIRRAGLFELALAAGGSAGGGPARTLYQRAAALGDARAAFNLGSWDYNEGNLAAAWDWFEQAEAAGLPEATVLLARLEREQGLFADGLATRARTLLSLATDGSAPAKEEAWQYAIASSDDAARRDWAAVMVPADPESLPSIEPGAFVSYREQHLDMLVAIARTIRDAKHHDDVEVRQAAAAELEGVLSYTKSALARLTEEMAASDEAQEGSDH